MAEKAETIAFLRRALSDLEEKGATSPSAYAKDDAPCLARDAFADDGDEKTAEEAFRKILRWVSVRERSSHYLRERLLKDDFGPEVVEEALERSIRCRAVDDRRYCDALIRMKLAAGKGMRGALAEIEELGVDPQSLDAWQEHAERGREAEVERALCVLRRHPPRAKAARAAAYRKLIGRGYDSDIASTAARLWSQETEAGCQSR